MVFRKEFIVYQGKDCKVYINQCHNPKKKTKLFAIRRDDKKGCARYLGKIFFSGAWRQYVSEFDEGTIWSSGCKKKICEFEDLLNKQFREGLTRKNHK